MLDVSDYVHYLKRLNVGILPLKKKKLFYKHVTYIIISILSADSPKKIALLIHKANYSLLSGPLLTPRKRPPQAYKCTSYQSPYRNYSVHMQPLWIFFPSQELVAHAYNLATQEAEIRRIPEDSLGQIVHEPLSWKKPITKKCWWSGSQWRP
jgi:hypothetical protein